MRQTKLKKDQKEAQEPPDLRRAHQLPGHRDRGFCTLSQPRHEQPEQMPPPPWAKHSLNIASPTRVCAELSC